MEKAEWVFTNLHFRMQTAPAPIRVLYYRYTCERPVVMHTHEFSELVLVTGGCARHTAVSADGEKFTRILSRGDVLLIHEGEAHDFRLEPGGELEICNVVYSPQALGQLFRRDDPDSRALQVIDTLPRQPAVFRLGETVQLTGEQLERTGEYARTIYEEGSHPHDGSAAMQILLLGALLTVVGRQFLETHFSGPAVADKAEKRPVNLEPVFGYIHEHYCEPLSLAYLSGLAICTPRHLSRQFKRAAGMTVSAYIRQLRLTKACYLLRHTRLQNNEIALKTGYQEYAGFAKAFRAYTGFSPTRYRRLPDDETIEKLFANRNL